MKIKSLKRLSKLQKQEIAELQELCRENDSTKSFIYLKCDLNFTQEMRCFFLCYEESLLISILVLFVPGEEEAEVTGFTRPEYRGRGYFSALLKKAAGEAAAFDIPRLLYVCEPQCNAASEIVNAKRAASEISLSHSEYMMKLTINQTFLASEASDLSAGAEPSGSFSASPASDAAGIIVNPAAAASSCSLTEALPSDKEAIVSLTQTYFSGSYEEESKWFDNMLASKDTRLYKFLVEGIGIIGSSGVSLGPESACIYGLGISLAYRGKGYGKKLLELLLRRLASDGYRRVTLEVSSTNAAAFNMYKKAGFETEAQIDYYLKEM